MTGTFPQAWEETAIMTIQKLAGTAYEFAVIIDEIDLPEGDYPGESIPTASGGRIWKQSPKEDGELSFTVYGFGLDTTAAQGLMQEFNGGTWDTSVPMSTDTSWVAGVQRTRDRFMVALMWTDDAAQTGANDVTSTADATALRFYAKECRIITHKASFTDKILKMSVTFKYPAMNYAGTTACCAWESTNDGDSTTALPALTYSTAL